LLVGKPAFFARRFDSAIHSDIPNQSKDNSAQIPALSQKQSSDIFHSFVPAACALKIWLYARIWR
jgi:hypothetical protein